MLSDKDKKITFETGAPLLQRVRNRLSRFGRVAQSRWLRYPIPEDPQGLWVDALIAIDDESFYVKGWMKDQQASITRLTAIAPSGHRTDLIDTIVRYPRADVEEFYGVAAPAQDAGAGFSGYFKVPAPSAGTGTWKLQIQNATKRSRTALARSVNADAGLARAVILQDLHAVQRRDEDRFLRNHVSPAIHRLQERLQQALSVDSFQQYGSAVASPTVSIIVPLYQRIDFLEQQLAQFAHDPDIGQADLMYILDSPELADDLRHAAAQLHRLYQVPFRVVVLNRNAGFSGANNIGASLAHGRLLLLLNSDVFPETPGWIGRMQAFYDATAGIGALGPKLVFEDDSLQHAGMFFSRPVGASLWENVHYFKGLHRQLPAANVTRPVPAVTGACLMIGKDLYQRMGGLRGIYVQGDYEDSDLCLRLIEAGYRNWYLPSVELYHLEAQSYPDDLRRFTRRYNTWLHTATWNARMTAVMAASACDSHNAPAETNV